jgi:hypothetical protein
MRNATAVGAVVTSLVTESFSPSEPKVKETVRPNKETLTPERPTSTAHETVKHATQSPPTTANRAKRWYMSCPSFLIHRKGLQQNAEIAQAHARMPRINQTCSVPPSTWAVHGGNLLNSFLPPVNLAGTAKPTL